MASKVLASDYQYLLQQLKLVNGVEILLDNLRNSPGLKIQLNTSELVNIMLRTAMVDNIELFDRVAAGMDDERMSDKIRLVMAGLLNDPAISEVLKIHIRLNYPYRDEQQGYTGPCPVKHGFRVAHMEIDQEAGPIDQLKQLDLNDK